MASTEPNAQRRETTPIPRRLLGRTGQPVTIFGLGWGLATQCHFDNQSSNRGAIGDKPRNARNTRKGEETELVYKILRSTLIVFFRVFRVFRG